MNRRIGFILNNQDVNLAKLKPQNYSEKEKLQIVSFLENQGEVILGSPGVVQDIFNKEKIAGSKSEIQYGQWIWPDYLAYYVKVYSIKLNKEFISFVLKKV